jgi:acetyl-CoA carboxylase biotin carboxyl carrier protein
LANTSGAWLEAVRQVLRAVSATDVTDFELTSSEFSVRIRRELDVSRPAPLGPEQSDAHLHNVVAPFTGVFYRSPTPSARAYVEPGDWVDAEAVIGLVETMKIFNEVTADVAGRIVRFVASGGELVHAGDTLVLIEPGERATAESEPHV